MGKSKGYLTMTIIAIVVLVAFITLATRESKKGQEAKIARQTKVDSVKAAKEIETKRIMYYVPPQSEQPSLKTWEKIPPEGIKVCLHRGWRTFPIGGNLKIIDPDGGEMYDKLGEKINFGFRSEGWYRVYPDPIGSERGVEILARWCF